MKPGVYLHKDGVEFVVHSTTESMTLLLFDNEYSETPQREIVMKRTRNLRHVFVKGVRPGQLYLYCNGAQQLLDPCARALHTPYRWGEKNRARPKCVVVDPTFDWGCDAPPRIPLEQTIVYEAHLRGFTGGGTYLDWIDKIPHLIELGITAVELLPIFEFNELEFYLRDDARRELLNFWGYSTLGFFAPMSRYAADRAPGAAVHEFKRLVKALHAAGIEIILDVVFNHTGEGPRGDQTYHFRALDPASYYLTHADGTDQNWSGCGNTVNANHPVTRQFIVDCLKYWVSEMHVDGFRFDLATSLCRSETGDLLAHPPLLKAIEAEAALQHVKLIAEAWDCGGYQVGQFPSKRFSDWNGKFRDDVRRFWNEHRPVAELATRLAGSSDLYHHAHGGPLHSINFVTAHDGFTLADLVSYSQKHNAANGEKNRDGENQNFSCNFGAEGPSDDPALRARRLQQQKNLLATLFFSQGVPMLLAGDELGRTQRGNNNAYCQDGALSWIDWAQLDEQRELFEFTRQLIALRKAHPALRRKKHFTGKSDVHWIGPDGTAPDWHRNRAIGMWILGKDPLLLLINNERHAVTFSAPICRASRPPSSNEWHLKLSSAPVRGLTLPPHSLALYSSKRK